MAQCNKRCSNTSKTPHPAAPIAVPTPPPSSCSSTQPSMRRYIAAAPSAQVQQQLLTHQQAALLRAMEKQNCLLTELLASVNGIVALLCRQKESD